MQEGHLHLPEMRLKEYDELPQKYPWMERTGKRINENNLYIAERLYTKEDFIIIRTVMY